MARKERPTNTWHCSNGVHLPVTALRIDQSLLAHCWWPLHRVNRSAIHAGLRWAVHLDEFCLVGLHGRSRGPAIWVYVHNRTGAEIYVDGDGQTYKHTRLRSEPIKGRFRACDVKAAVQGAGLHLGQARAQTEAAPLPPDRGFDDGPAISAPRVLRPGRRIDAMRRARVVTGNDLGVSSEGRQGSIEPLDLPLGGPRANYIAVLPGPPRTRDFVERWEPHLLLDDPSAQAGFDALEMRRFRNHEATTPPAERSPSPVDEARLTDPTEDRPAPSRSRANHPSQGVTRPSTSRPRARASTPHLRQVWPPTTRPRRWPKT